MLEQLDETLGTAAGDAVEAEIRRQFRADQAYAQRCTPLEVELDNLEGRSAGRGPYGTGGGRRRPKRKPAE